jgi:hypothetical protein
MCIQIQTEPHRLTIRRIKSGNLLGLFFADAQQLVLLESGR